MKIFSNSSSENTYSSKKNNNCLDNWREVQGLVFVPDYDKSSTFQLPTYSLKQQIVQKDPEFPEKYNQKRLLTEQCRKIENCNKKNFIPNQEKLKEEKSNELVKNNEENRSEKLMQKTFKGKRKVHQISKFKLVNCLHNS